MDRGRRYKERGLQFASAEDSRAIRAVESQAGRKARRDALLSRRRMDGLDESMEGKETNKPRKLAVPAVMITKKIERELALQRYQDLLQWREERRKKSVFEKRKRKPSFKTGLYQPDQPKFLVSDDVKVKDSKECTPAKPTPFKYLQRSSSKYGFTPGTSVRKVPRFCTGVTPVATSSNVPKFTLLTTPTQSVGRAAMLHRRHPEQKENFPGPSCARQNTDIKSQARMKSKATHEVEMKRILRRRGNKRPRAVLENEDLGVKALPRTPKICQEKSIDCEEAKSALPSVGSSSLSLGNSFAPDHFSFIFNKNTSSKESRPEDEEKLQEQLDSDSIFSEAEEKNYAKAQECADTVGPETGCKGSEKDLICKTVSRDTSSRIELSRKEEEAFVSASTKSRKIKTVNISDLGTKTMLTGSSVLVNKNVLVKTADKGKSTEISEDDKLEGDLEIKEITNIELENETVSMTENVDAVKDADVDCCSPAYKTKLRDEAKLKSPKIDFEVLDAEKVTDQSLPEVKYDVSLREETPLPLRPRSTRYSKRHSSCADILTPLISRLRPRTPCSRSTRRSHDAHCDFLFEVVATPSKPSSTRRRSRRSASIALKMSDVREPPIPLKLDEEISKSLANKFSEGIDNTSFLIKENHIIEEENEDQAVTAVVGECMEDEHTDFAEIKSLKKDFMQTPKQDDIVTPCGSRRQGKVSWMIHDSPYINTEKRSYSRRSEVPADMRGLFDDIPTDGSPLPAHLIPLLAEGRKIQEAMSPIQPVLEANSSAIQDGHSSPGEEQTCTNLLALLEASTPPERTDSPDYDVWGEESHDIVNDSIQTETVPNTDAALLLPVPSTDAAVLLPAPATRRKSSRISLLPGMSNSPLAAEKLSVNSEDLISWKTPVSSAKKMSKEHLVTPCRRSRRLSKACPQ